MSTRKVNITLTIRAAFIKVEQDVETQILWMRGSKKIDTRVKVLSAEKGSASFNEKFQMKTSLDYNADLQKFIGKKSTLKLVTKDGVLLGESFLDLAKYANDQTVKKDRLPMEKCEDSKAYIEIGIVAKPDEDAALKSETTAFSKRGMEPIQERQNDTETKFELEKQEKELST